MKNKAQGPAVEEKREHLLELSSALLHNLILSAVDGVVAADLEGRILIFNEVAAELLGYTPQEALESLNIRDLYPENEALVLMRKLRDEGHGGRGKVKSLQVRLRRKDGQTVPVSLNASLVYEQGREVATVGFFHDLRESLRMKEELDRTHLQLMQAEKMSSLGKLAAGVAHQLNNPLNGILLYTVLTMEEFALQEEVKKNLYRIRSNAERCRDTVRELLEFARQSNRSTRPHNINLSVERTLFLLENQPLFHNIRIERQLSAALPLIPVDVQQMNHVFMNIILNAADAMHGQGTLTVKSSSAGGSVLVEIADTGSGIPADVLPHIFEPFFTTKEPGKGTGLGLSVAYGIVNDHNGTIRVESEPGRGARFIVELPAAPGTPEGAEVSHSYG